MPCHLLSVLWLNLHTLLLTWTFPLGLSSYENLKCSANTMDNLQMKVKDVYMKVMLTYLNTAITINADVKMILFSMILSF